MDFFKISMLLLQSCAVFLNVFGLPGGIISAVFPVVLYFKGYLFTNQLVWVLGIILFGEFIEFYAAYAIGRRYRVDKRSFWVSVLGAFVLGLIMSPMFFGAGAVIGTFAGAYLAPLIYETMRGTSLIRAKDIARGLLFGRFLGTFTKIAAGLTAVFTVYKLIY